VSLDRTAIQQAADTFVRQGQFESAIAEYLRLSEDQPQDWTIINALGDLYARTGQPDKAVEQFARAAEQLGRDGFLSKAAAVWKKVLKLKPDDEGALLSAADIAARQGLVVDARSQILVVLERRDARGDGRGSAEARVRLGALDSRDYSSRRAAAQARLELGDVAGAIGDLERIAADLLEERRPEEAFDVELGLAQLELSGNSPDDGLRRMDDLLQLFPSRRDDVVSVGWTLGERAPERGYGVVDLVVDRAAASGDWPVAVAVLEGFLSRVPNHVPALLRLVDVCGAGGLDTVDAARMRLDAAFAAAEAAHGQRRAVVIASPEIHAAESDLTVRPQLSGAAEAVHETDVDLDAVFNRMRIEAARRRGVEDGEPHLARALALREAGDVDGCLAALEAAWHTPSTCVQAASLIGQMLLDLGREREAAIWLERAASGRG